MTPARVVPADSPPELTTAQLAEARVWMQAARVWTIERHPYLDTALTSILLVPRPGLGTVGVDARWRLYYDPARTLAIAKEHGIAMLASDWVHEAMHLLRDHLDRWDALRHPPRQHPVFNIAGDALVNADVSDLSLPLLSSDVTFESLPPKAGCTRTMPTEEIYVRLLEHVEFVSGTGHDCGSGAGGGRRPWEEPLTDDADDGSIDDDRADVIREDTARNVQAAVKAAGAVPNGLRMWADSILEPTIDWRAELRSIVSKRLGQAAGVTDYSFTRQARRRVSGYTLPGMVSAAPPRAAAVVDTSGSMTPAELAQCLGDLLGLSRAISGDGTAVTVITCDTQVRAVHVVRVPAHVRELQLTGGGGTDMSVGLEACAALRPAPDVVVVLTDGYTPWPAHPPVGLDRATVIALITEPTAARHVPAWMRAIAVA